MSNDTFETGAPRDPSRSGGSAGAVRSPVSSLRALAQDIGPARDLWPTIHAQIAAEPQSNIGRGGSSSRWRVLALAAVISALAVGVWLGRSVLPGAGTRSSQELVRKGPETRSPGAPRTYVLPAAFVTTPEYVKERKALLASFEQQVRSLPPETRDKVLTSLSNIRDSMKDIQEALGREPGNALLQELLVNTYQDEMRVLTAVHEAGEARKET
jgi:hypothetical protein